MTEFKRVPGTDYIAPADHWLFGETTLGKEPEVPTLSTEALIESIMAAIEAKQRQWKYQTEKIECRECGRRVVVEDFNTLRVCKCLFEKLRSLRQRTGPAKISEPRLTAQVFGLNGIEIRCDP